MCLQRVMCHTPMAVRGAPVTQPVLSGGLISPRALTPPTAKVPWACGSHGDLHFADTYSWASRILLSCPVHTRHNVRPAYTKSYLLIRRVHGASWEMQPEEEPQRKKSFATTIPMTKIAMFPIKLLLSLAKYFRHFYFFHMNATLS